MKTCKNIFLINPTPRGLISHHPFPPPSLIPSTHHYHDEATLKLLGRVGDSPALALFKIKTDAQNSARKGLDLPPARPWIGPRNGQDESLPPLPALEMIVECFAKIKSTTTRTFLQNVILKWNKINFKITKQNMKFSTI